MVLALRARNVSHLRRLRSGMAWVPSAAGLGYRLPRPTALCQTDEREDGAVAIRISERWANGA